MNDEKTDEFRRFARIFKALSDPTRLQILRRLQEGEDCANVIQRSLGLSQSGLSYHMKILAEAGLVNCRQVAQRTYYSLNTEQLNLVADLISSLGMRT